MIISEIYFLICTTGSVLGCRILATISNGNIETNYKPTLKCTLLTGKKRN